MNYCVIDVETACAVLGCTDSACMHALSHKHSRITVAAARGSNGTTVVTRDEHELRTFVEAYSKAVFFNHKFDRKILADKWRITFQDDSVEDVHLMSVASSDKIPDTWLEDYELSRKVKNKDGGKHRNAGRHSLKCVAPYFLGVEPFWEVADKDDDKYVLTDVEHTAELYEFFHLNLSQEDKKFYHWLLEKSHTLLKAEQAGIRLDLDVLSVEEKVSAIKAIELAEALKDKWAAHLEAYQQEQERTLSLRYQEMEQKWALSHPTMDPDKVRERYVKLYDKARLQLEPLNLDSPTQLKWLLKDRLGLDVTNMEGDESTGRGVLQKLADQGNPDMRLFLDYRKNRKLSTAFYPSYRAMQSDGNIHCSFNPSGTRTGRLSSSQPNLQQVPGHLHKLFVARPGKLLADFDMSAIEPRLIAYYAECPVLFQLINEDLDFHGYCAKVFFNLPCPISEVKEKFPDQRKLAKTVDLALMYGAGVKRIVETARQQGFNYGETECRRMLDNFKREFKAVYKFKKELDSEYTQNPVRNLFGRPMFISHFDHIHMQGFNSLIQSSASDLVLESAHRINKELGTSGTVLLLVHDEIVTEIDEATKDKSAEVIKRVMTDYRLPTRHGLIRLSVEGKVGPRWEK